MSAPPNITPMLRQYLDIKEQHKHDILFYRMGDFYEMFFEDAEIASKILNITLTSRNNKSDTAKVPMCGVPYHAAQTYIARLVKAGRRVAICEQTEDPAEAKGIVKRDVVRVVTPGVVTDELLLDENENCYVSSVHRGSLKNQTVWGIGFLDLSTGDFRVGEFRSAEAVPAEIIDQFTRMNPAEIIVSEEEQSSLAPFLSALEIQLPAICLTGRPSHSYHYDTSLEKLSEHFKVNNMDGFGCKTMKQGLIAAASLLDYAHETQKSSITHIEKITPIALESTLIIDDSSRRNLELTQTIIGSKREGSLLWVMDQTATPMGARLLKNYLLSPLQAEEQINERLESVDFLYQHSGTRKQVIEALTTIYDIERLNSRMVLGQANARDALAMKMSFSRLPEMLQLLQTCEAPLLENISISFDTLADLHDLLDSAIADDPPATLRDGNIIKQGYNSELDDLILLLRDGKQLILELENKERERTGIPKLKIGYNKVFGYFIEISKTHSNKAPDHYIRKQTLVNAERFITPELKEFENRVLSAQERKLELEYQLFQELRTTLAGNSGRLIATANALAQVDVLSCFAAIARRYHYTRPVLKKDGSIAISEGRHPVIERSMPAGKFVPNDIKLDQATNQMLIITGPNMAGKSTILRQTALIVLMAQMGSYVPAQNAEISSVDRIFTRVGAMDDLRRGQSTFMVEMSETANILNNATGDSLVILDEIGRGTSTYDGLSIAWSVAEALAGKDGAGVKTLFATHYHELTELARTIPGVQNYSVSVKEWNDTIIFLHKLVKGGTSRSYGIQVAALAGVPPHVVKRAEEILKKIDRGEFDFQSGAAKERTGDTAEHRTAKPNQMSLFTPPAHPVVTLLENTDVDDLTPRQALELLYEIQAQFGLK